MTRRAAVIGTAQTLRVDDAAEPLGWYDKYLPVGTAVVAIGNSRQVWTKVRDGIWAFRDGGHYQISDMAHYRLKIQSMPVEEVTIPQPTVEQAMWNFRVGAMQAAASHGYQGQRAITDALNNMGVGNDLAVTIGQGVPVDEQARAALPDGSVVYSGHPTEPDLLSVHVKRNGRWTHVLGERTHLDQRVVVDSVAGARERPDWLDREGTDADLKAIQDFQAKVWRVGWDLKQQMGWCGTYEAIMKSLGVTEAALHYIQVGGHAVGERLTYEEVADLRAGSLLWWQHRDEPEKFALFVRDDTTTNRARTRRVFASAAVTTHDQYMRRMVVESLVDGNNRVTGGWLIPIRLLDEVWPLLPPGTVFRHQEGAQEYVICGDHRAMTWRGGRVAQPPAVGQYVLRDFGGPENAQLRVVRA